MKKLIIAFAGLGLLTACHTAKTVTQMASVQKTEQKNDVAASNVETTTANRTTDEQSGVMIRKTVKTTVYDPDKPIVPGTARPPVKSETEETTEQEATTRKKAIEVTNVSKKSELTDKTKTGTTIQTKTKITSIPQKPGIAYLWYILVLITAIAIAIAVKRYWSEIRLFLAPLISLIKKLFKRS
jgi:hypothetical protein